MTDTDFLTLGFLAGLIFVFVWADALGCVRARRD